MPRFELIAEPFTLREITPAANTFTLLPTTASGPFQGWVWPMPVWNGRNPVITNGFDPTPSAKWGMKHAGVDIMYLRHPNESARLPEGHKRFFVPSDRIPVYAVGNGVVIQSGKNPLGHHVIIDHGNGYHTFYQHLTANGLPPKSTRVAAGMPIGFVGHNPFPGGYPLNHLHFEIWPGGVKGRAIDPGQVLSRRLTPAQPPSAAPAGRNPKNRGWVDTLVPLLNKHRGDIPLDYLLGWIAFESGGRIGVITQSLNERGYFQIHPGESKMLGLDHERLSRDPDYSVWGGIQLVKYYAKRAQVLGARPGSDFFWGVVKLGHWLPLGVQTIMGDLRKQGLQPASWEEFKAYVLRDQQRLAGLIKAQYLRNRPQLHTWDLPPKWHPKVGIDVVDKVFRLGREHVAGLANP